MDRDDGVIRNVHGEEPGGCRSARPEIDRTRGSGNHEEPHVFLETAYYREDVEHLVRKAVSRMPKEYAEMLLLQRDRGLNYHDMAFVTGVEEQVVRSRARRAREMLKELLSEGGIIYGWAENIDP